MNKQGSVEEIFVWLIIAGIIFFLCLLFGEHERNNFGRIHTIGYEAATAVPRRSNIRFRPAQVQLSLSDEESKRFHDERKEADHKQVVNVQNRLRLRGLQTTSQLNCKLIIAVDARPTQTGGYCIDLTKRKCQAYTYKTDNLPWALNDRSMLGDPDEFEMKNFLFALLLWEDTIVANTPVRIYTDNNAIKNLKNKEAIKVWHFLKHLRQCRRVVIVNSDMHANRARDIECFAKYIQPADDLSRFRIYECKQFLKELYGLNEFECSYSQDSANGRRRKNNGTYSSYLKTVKASVAKWSISPCPTCRFYISDSDNAVPERKQYSHYSGSNVLF